jgi:hypothetical protein
VVGTAALIAHVAFGRLSRDRRRAAIAVVLAIPIVVAWLASAYVNRPLDRQWRALSAEDRPWSGSLTGTRRLAILGHATWCAALCQYLLYSGAVQVVLMGSPPGHRDAELDLTHGVTGYRVEPRASCPPMVRPERGIRSRIDAGDCLISEPATLAGSEVVVIDDVLMNGEARWLSDQGWLWRPSRNNLSAYRLSLYQVRDGRAREVFPRRRCVRNRSRRRSSPVPLALARKSISAFCE